MPEEPYGAQRIVERRARASRVASLSAQVVILLGALASGTRCDEPEEQPADEQKKQHSKAMEAMFERAKAARVTTENHPHPVQLIAEPLMHFSDPEINIVDAGLWAYSDGGRPQALLKVEAHLWRGDVLPQVTWVHCFVSTSSDHVIAVWPEGPRFAAREPGLKLEALTNGPEPADSPRARLTQMKQLARRFSAHCIDESQDELKLRLLPIPVHRYADSDLAVKDGAVFAFSASGTNPTLVLLIELHQPKGEAAKWEYSLSRMTVRQMTVKLDDHLVYEQGFAGFGGVQQASWMAFPQKGILPEDPEK